MDLEFGNEAADAKESGRPLVALESTVISHGLPYPRNLETARALEEAVRGGGAVPATIAVLNGQVRVGISDKELEFLAAEKDIRKISRRDIPVAIARKLNCATTVATTSFFANAAGIKVFATGGIGGVHRGYDKDISADLPELAQTPIVVVCSGAKIVLDLPATREWLETNGVTVLGWQCDELPAFYSRTSGLSIDERVESADDVARIAEARDAAGLRNAILVTVPVPKASELERTEVEGILADAMAFADERGIRGKDITPFLLSEMSSRSGGRTLTANIELLKNNAGVAAEIACAMKS